MSDSENPKEESNGSSTKKDSTDTPQVPSKRRRIEGCQFILDLANLGEELGVLNVLPGVSFEDLYWTFFAIGFAFALFGLIPNKKIKVICALLAEIVHIVVYVTIAPANDRGAGLIAIVVIFGVIQLATLSYIGYMWYKLDEEPEKRPKKQIFKSCCIKIWVYLAFNFVSTLLVYTESDTTTQTLWFESLITVHVFVSSIMNKLYDYITTKEIYKKIQAAISEEGAVEPPKVFLEEDTVIDKFLKIVSWGVIIASAIYTCGYLIFVLVIAIMGLEEQANQTDPSTVDRALFITVIIFVSLVITCIPCCFGVRQARKKGKCKGCCGGEGGDKKSCCC